MAKPSTHSVLSHWLGVAQEEHGLSSESEMVSRVLTVRGCKLIASSFWKGDPNGHLQYCHNDEKVAEAMIDGEG